MITFHFTFDTVDAMNDWRFNYYKEKLYNNFKIKKLKED